MNPTRPQDPLADLIFNFTFAVRLRRVLASLRKKVSMQ